MYKKFITLLIFMTVTACSASNHRPLYPAFMPDPPKGGPPEFQKGWKDGCDTGLAQHGTDNYRFAFGFTQDPGMVLNPVYYKAWKDGENFCRSYIFEHVFRSSEVWCSFDGLNDDCGNPRLKAGVPFLGGSSYGIGYSIWGSRDPIGNMMGDGTDGFLGNTTGMGSVLGNW